MGGGVAAAAAVRWQQRRGTGCSLRVCADGALLLTMRFHACRGAVREAVRELGRAERVCGAEHEQPGCAVYARGGRQPPYAAGEASARRPAAPRCTCFPRHAADCVFILPCTFNPTRWRTSMALRCGWDFQEQQACPLRRRRSRLRPPMT